MSEPVQDGPRTPDQPFASTLDPLQLEGLKKFWLRLDALLSPSDILPVDLLDKPTASLMNDHSPDQFRAAFWRWIMMDDPDMMVCKYLRARKWDLTAALKMLISCLKWRLERNVDAVKENDNIRAQLRTGKAFIQGVDRSGCPIARITAAKHKPSDQTAADVEEFVIYTMESTRLFMVPPAETASIMVDLSGFGMSSMDWKCTSFMITCLEAYYPETLNFQIIHNAPWIFQGIWRVISSMLDPVVKSKVLMTKSQEDLLRLVDKSNLAEADGGTSDWTWTCPAELPAPSGAESDTDTRERECANRDKLADIYGRLTREWASLHPAVPVDALRIAELARTRELVRLMLRAHYFKLMPYIKPPTVYHQHKTLAADQPGVVQFRLHSTAPDGLRVLGEAHARDRVLAAVASMRAEFERDGTELPDIDFEL